MKTYKSLVREKTGREFPAEPAVQLGMSRDAVFNSWNNPRAVTYRKLNDIPANLGTAVNVKRWSSGTWGKRRRRAWVHAQSLDRREGVVRRVSHERAGGGRRGGDPGRPRPIAALGQAMAEVFRQLSEITTRLEKHYRDVQDFEFTVQEGRLYMLQTRTGEADGARP